MGQDLKRNLFFEEMHLQWFADAAPADAVPAAAPPAPAPAPQPAPEPELKADGTWAAQLPDRLKKDPAILKDLLGKDSPRRCENLGAVLDRMYAAETSLTELQAKAAGQAPEFKLEDYSKLKLPPVPEFMRDPAFRAHNENLGAYLQDASEAIKTLAVELKLAPSVAQRVLELFAKRHVDAFKAGMDDQLQRREKAVAALKVEWKGEFAANEELAKRALRTFGGVELAHEIAAAGFADHPAMVRIFRNIGAAMGEGHLVPGRPSPSPEGAVSGSGQPARPDLKKRFNKSPELFGAGR